jgi:hypothetical protein
LAVFRLITALQPEACTPERSRSDEYHDSRVNYAERDPSRSGVVTNSAELPLASLGGASLSHLTARQMSQLFDRLVGSGSTRREAQV